jgi:2'-5' RNA ligase
MVRAFVAIDLCDEVRAEIREAQELLKTCSANLSLVDPGIIHLTLKFLGEVDELKIGKVIGVLQQISREPFWITVCGPVGSSRSKPRVIWCNVMDQGECRDLHARVEEALAPLGFERENREFLAHATVARVKKFHPSLYEILGTMPKGSLGNCIVKGMRLKKSTLTPRGPVYEDLLEVAF